MRRRMYTPSNTLPTRVCCTKVWCLSAVRTRWAVRNLRRVLQRYARSATDKPSSDDDARSGPRVESHEQCDAAAPLAARCPGSNPSQWHGRKRRLGARDSSRSFFTDNATRTSTRSRSTSEWRHAAARSQAEVRESRTVRESRSIIDFWRVRSMVGRASSDHLPSQRPALQRRQTNRGTALEFLRHRFDRKIFEGYGSTSTAPRWSYSIRRASACWRRCRWMMLRLLYPRSVSHSTRRFASSSERVIAN